MHPVTLNALAQFPTQLGEHYAAIPQHHRHWSPPSWDGVPSEPFTAIEQLCHVRDIEIDGYQVRIQRVLNETNPFLPGIDGHKLATERAYATADADTVLNEIHVARRKTIAVLAGLSTEDFNRPANFQDYGPVRLRSLIHYLCSHDQQHIAGLQWLLGKIESTSHR
ncbi:MAG TPA: DinB family protein [Steroidobacteraceae bacterium]|nr:DinB family protein [Steroidobacteraceae bacterium]